jgi:colanic acid/amylovoran biosynthesis glycosyltransferase
MKVAYITMQFPRSSETFASNDVRKLAGRGVAVSVHALRPPAPECERLLRERRLERVPVRHNSVASSLSGLLVAGLRPRLLFGALSWLLRVTWRRPRHLLRSLALLPRSLAIFADLERERPDVVHIYWGHYPALVGYLVQRHLPEVALSMSLAAYDLHMRFGGTGEVARRAHAVRTLARENVAVIAETFGVPEERIHLIYDGVDTRRIQRLVEGVSRVRHRIVTAGRLLAFKGVAEVVETFAQVRRVHPGATLVILGDGPERHRLEARVRELGLEEAVCFRGHVSQEAVFEEMAQAEVFLFLSRSERLPNVVKEAMLCGCLCVTTATVGIREVVPDDRYGYVVPVGDVPAAVTGTT